jgi:hypothetical protein
MLSVFHSHVIQVREAMNDKRSEMSTRINVTTKETIHGSAAIEGTWDVRKLALGYAPPKGDEESGSFEPFDAPVLHRTSSPSEWVEKGSKYIPGQFLLSDQIMRVSLHVVCASFENILKIGTKDWCSTHLRRKWPRCPQDQGIRRDVPSYEWP